jgi:hypothetical protein
MIGAGLGQLFVHIKDEDEPAPTKEFFTKLV